MKKNTKKKKGTQEVIGGKKVRGEIEVYGGGRESNKGGKRVGGD